MLVVLRWNKKERKKKKGIRIPAGYAHASRVELYLPREKFRTTCADMALGNRTCSLLLSAIANGRVVKYLCRDNYVTLFI